jgi:hypothetical protein
MAVNPPPAGPGLVDDHPRVRPRPGCLPLALLALCTFWAVTAPFIGESNGRIVLVLYSLLIAWPVVAWLVVARWGGGTGWRIGIGLATPVALFLLWHLEVAALARLVHLFPPPRPAFRNDLVDDDRTLLPYWCPPMPMRDRRGHWAWADHRDNVLLLVLLGVPETWRGGGLAGGMSKYRVKVGPDDEERHVTLARTKDALVVVLPDGTHREFALGPGLARRFHETHRSTPVENLLREAGELLRPGEKAKFDEFLAGYREPDPKAEGR